MPDKNTPTTAISADEDTQTAPELSDQQIVSYIYDIALDPGNLDDFIDRLSADASENTGDALESGRIQTLSALLESHLSRAEEFLDRLSIEDSSSATQLALAPFDATPALLVNASLNIVDANTSAIKSYSIAVGDSIDALPFDERDVDTLFKTLREMLRNCSGKGTILALQPRSVGVDQQSPALFHAHWLDLQAEAAVEVAGRRGFVLLVSTDVSWPLALDQTLLEVFGLTSAERGVVRALVEGGTLKGIATDRRRSLGTVRTQLKSVLAKTQTHSQSELIRVTLSLMEIVKRSPLVGTTKLSDTGEKPSEQYAPIETITRTDGRRLDYLVQGHPQGKPILFSHMG